MPRQRRRPSPSRTCVENINKMKCSLPKLVFVGDGCCQWSSVEGEAKIQETVVVAMSKDLVERIIEHLAWFTNAYEPTCKPVRKASAILRELTGE